MEAVIKAEGGRNYPLLIDGLGPAPDEIALGPFHYAQFLEHWRKQGFGFNEDGTPEGIKLFDPRNVVFHDPDDVWIWMCCEYPLLIEMMEKGRHRFPLPYDRHAVMVPAR